MSKSKKQKCIIYARVSTTSAQQASSLLEQQQVDEDSQFYEWCERNDYEVYEVIPDDVSGTTLDRPGFEKLLKTCGIKIDDYANIQAMENGNIDIRKRNRKKVYTIDWNRAKYCTETLGITRILCKNTSRFTRDGNFEIIQMLRKIGIYIYFKDENIDTKNTDSDDMLKIIQVFDSNQSKSTSKKVLSGNVQSQKRNSIRTNKRIYGFRYHPTNPDTGEKGWLEKIEEEAKVIRLIFELYTGLSCDGSPNDTPKERIGTRQICNYLEEKGYKTREFTSKKGITIPSKPFSVSSIKRILANEKYCGWNNTTKKYDSGVVFNKNSYAVKVPTYSIKENDRIEPIIPKWMFDKAKEINNERVTQNAGATRGVYRGNSLYYHRVKCGKCGSWFSQNGDYDGNGTYVKKMNCNLKKTKGTKSCDNINVSMSVIDKIFETIRQKFAEYHSFHLFEEQLNLSVMMCYYAELLMNDNTVEKIAKCNRKKKEMYSQWKEIEEKLKSCDKREITFLEMEKEELLNDMEELDNEIETLDNFRDTTVREIELLMSYMKLNSKYQHKQDYTLEEVFHFKPVLEIFPDVFYFSFTLATEFNDKIDEFKKDNPELMKTLVKDIIKQESVSDANKTLTKYFDYLEKIMPINRVYFTNEQWTAEFRTTPPENRMILDKVLFF